MIFLHRDIIIEHIYNSILNTRANNSFCYRYKMEAWGSGKTTTVKYSEKKKNKKVI